MKNATSIGFVMVAMACIAFGNEAVAATFQTFGPGSAVTSFDRSTNFDDLDFAHNGTPLSDYQTNGLSVTTNGNSYYGDNTVGQIGIDGIITSNSPYFNPFHLTSASGPGESYINVGGGFYFPYDGSLGNTDWITIQTIDAMPIYALEFLYGNGWTNGDIFGPLPWGSNNAVLEWQTYRANSLVSSGFVTTNVGTVIGFSDLNGFDQLRVRATANSIPADLQELALDNLNVQLVVPEPSTMALATLGGLALLGSKWSPGFQRSQWRHLSQPTNQ
jgi:hypothetical protein